MKRSLALHIPTVEELSFRQSLLSDPDTMSYNHAWGGVIDFPREDWCSWYSHWIENCGGKRFYRYLQREDGAFVGEVAYHLDRDKGIVLLDVIVHAKFRGQGYGSEGLSLLCEAARANGVSAVYDDLALNNSALSMFLGHGFVEQYRNESVIMLKKDLD